MSANPTPVEEHYVRKLLAMSSCFMDGQGSQVCFSEPCACAQTLLQEIGRPLQFRIDRLKAELRNLMEEMGGHYHWDSNGTVGANCPTCRRQTAAVDRAVHVLAET